MLALWLLKPGDKGCEILLASVLVTTLGLCSLTHSGMHIILADPNCSKAQCGWKEWIIYILIFSERLVSIWIALICLCNLPERLMSSVKKGERGRLHAHLKKPEFRPLKVWWIKRIKDQRWLQLTRPGPSNYENCPAALQYFLCQETVPVPKVEATSCWAGFGGLSSV